MTAIGQVLVPVYYRYTTKSKLKNTGILTVYFLVLRKIYRYFTGYPHL